MRFKRIKKGNYYIASVKTKEVKSNITGRVMTSEDRTVWLGYESGYPACWTNKELAEHFKTPEYIRKHLMEWDGMPWYYRIKPETLKIYRVTVEKTVEEIETEVK